MIDIFVWLSYLKMILSVFGMNICNLAISVELQLHSRLPELESSRLGISDVLLNLLDLGSREGVINSLPEPRISNVGLDLLVFDVVVLSERGNTISSSMRYSLTILLCWK
jgi:hypothetical protein